MSQDLKPYLQMFIDHGKPVTVGELAKINGRCKTFLGKKAIQLFKLGYLARRGIGKMLPYYYDVKNPCM